MAPGEVEVLLWCHYSPHVHPRFAVEWTRDVLARFESLGVIEKAEPHHTNETPGTRYVTTALGKAWVEAICRTPMPRQVFVDSHGEIL